MIIRPTRSETRGRFRVTAFAREGTYALLVPQASFGKLMYRIVKQRPLTIDFGRTNTISINFNIKGIRPLGRTARREVTYTPLRKYKPKPKKDKKKTTGTKPATETQKQEVPRILEYTSAVQPEPAPLARRNKEKGGKTKTGKNKKATAA
jgi:hypothetical protein